MSTDKMDKYAVRKEIASLIDSIKDHSDNIGNRRHIPQLELELILHKIEKLYQKSIVFNYLNAIDGGEGVNTEKVVQNVITPAPEKKAEPVVPAPEVKQEPVAPVTPVAEVKQEPVTPPVAEVKQPEKKEEVLPPPPAAEVKQPEKKEEIITPPAEEKKPEPKKETPVAPVTPPVSKKYPDIKTMIGFNEKIMFMRNLFAGDAATYEEALKQVNACSSYEEAKAFVDVLKNEYRWKSDDDSTTAFLDLVKRRFA